MALITWFDSGLFMGHGWCHGVVGKVTADLVVSSAVFMTLSCLTTGLNSGLLLCINYGTTFTLF